MSVAILCVVTAGLDWPEGADLRGEVFGVAVGIDKLFEPCICVVILIELLEGLPLVAELLTRDDTIPVPPVDAAREETFGGLPGPGDGAGFPALDDG